MLKMTMISNQWWAVMLWVQRWLISPTHAVKTLLQWGHVRHGGVSCSALLLLVLLDGFIDSMLFIGSHPSVDLAVPGAANLDSFHPGVRAITTALHGDLQSVFVVLHLAYGKHFPAFSSPLSSLFGRCSSDLPTSPGIS